MPLTETVEYHATKYYAPKNLNFWYYFGVFALFVLVVQIVSGIWLAMMYVPSGDGAFASVEYIMRDVDYGYLLRYIHSTGASAFLPGHLPAHVSRVWHTVPTGSRGNSSG